MSAHRLVVHRRHRHVRKGVASDFLDVTVHSPDLTDDQHRARMSQDGAVCFCGDPTGYYCGDCGYVRPPRWGNRLEPLPSADVCYPARVNTTSPREGK